MFWKNWNWLERILSVALPGLAFAIFYPVFTRSHEGGHRPSCQSNLKQIGLAFAQYEQDYDNDFPPIITGGSAYGWADALQPYIKSTRLYHCYSVKGQGQQESRNSDPRQSGYIDYPFNAELGRKSINSLQDVSWQIVSLDGNDGREVTNARYCLTEVPPLWFQDADSPLHRHLNTASYLFADGHVKSLKPEQFSTNKHLVF